MKHDSTRTLANLIFLCGLVVTVLAVYTYSTRLALLLCGILLVCVGALASLAIKEEQTGRHHFVDAVGKEWCAICGQDRNHLIHIID